MFSKIENWLTMGGQYVASAIVYLGLALILGGTTLLDFSEVRAEEESGCTYTVEEEQEGRLVPVTYDGCPAGKMCCGGECVDSEDMQCCGGESVPASYICCEDGTSGDADTCACLSCDCEESPVETITCDNE